MIYIIINCMSAIWGLIGLVSQLETEEDLCDIDTLRDAIYVSLRIAFGVVLGPLNIIRIKVKLYINRRLK